MKTLTKKDLNKLVEELKQYQLTDDSFKSPFNSNALFGIPILESKLVQDLEPVIKLSEEVNVSIEFRNKCNQFYIDMFGYKEPDIYRMSYGLIMGKNTRNLLFNHCTA